MKAGSFSIRQQMAEFWIINLSRRNSLEAVGGYRPTGFRKESHCVKRYHLGHIKACVITFVILLDVVTSTINTSVKTFSNQLPLFHSDVQ